MYYRYKTRKKNRFFLKFSITALILVTAVYMLYKEHGVLEIWNYSENKVIAKINEINRAPKNVKDEAIKNARSAAEKYSNENPLNPDPCFLLAAVECAAGENELMYDYSGMLVRDDSSVNDNAKKYFFNAIKLIKKGISLNNSSKIPDDCMIKLAKSYFYTGYYSNEEIYPYINKIDNPLAISSRDDKIFYCIMLLKEGKDSGLAVLKREIKENDFYGRIILAGAYQETKQYTNAIVEYKNLLAVLKDEEMLKIVNMNIGRIYFTQSLYKEALSHLQGLVTENETDLKLRVIMEKCYNETGDKINAKKFSTLNNTNTAVQK
jgi:tetratricopeptide (TPR) repeat protein